MIRVLRLTLLEAVMVEVITDGKPGLEVRLARQLEPFPAEWAGQPDVASCAQCGGLPDSTENLLKTPRAAWSR